MFFNLTLDYCLDWMLLHDDVYEIELVELNTKIQPPINPSVLTEVESTVLDPVEFSLDFQNSNKI
jgi:hypothetical protein